MTTLAFIDTETTSLRHDRRAWEIAVIVREPGKDDAEHSWFVHEHELDLGSADLMSLRIGRFHERHPQMQPGSDQSPDSPLRTKVKSEFEVLRQVEALTRGAHLVGAVPSFDAEVLGYRMRANGICPSWHYHLCCVENLASGWLNAYAANLEKRDVTHAERAAELRAIASPPWNSEHLSEAVGVDPAQFDRHTAPGDAKWARAIWDAVTG